MSSIKNPLAAILDSNKFTGLNYQDWLRNHKIVLASEKLLYTLEKTPPKEAPADASPEELAKLDKWWDDELKARVYVIASMSNEMQRRFEKMERLLGTSSSPISSSSRRHLNKSRAEPPLCPSWLPVFPANGQHRPKQSKIRKQVRGQASVRRAMKQLRMQHANNQCYEMHVAVKGNQSTRPVHQPANHIKSPQYHGLSTGKSSVRDHRGPSAHHSSAVDTRIR
ncbi:hypothetical protein F511_44966 [Dorcoceras hygrometricum]|uniref:Uncharacterized protein n=1 Tax=Dorcoceras hygrometricum TaxID=472368 RepID=A0A2Z7BXQ0_9LAMI|nr:hypothetical protein F511_44966 [Dorcoceras hygrometricum]